jgi:hypothetical protein
LLRGGFDPYREAQVIAVERKKEKPEAHGEIETEYPGYLVAQDTCFVGTIKGAGRIYQQTVIDAYSPCSLCKALNLVQIKFQRVHLKSRVIAMLPLRCC